MIGILGLFSLPWTWWILCESQILTLYFRIFKHKWSKQFNGVEGSHTFFLFKDLKTCKQQLHWKIFQFVSLMCSLAFKQFQVQSFKSKVFEQTSWLIYRWKAEVAFKYLKTVFRCLITMFMMVQRIKSFLSIFLHLKSDQLETI